MMRIISHEEQLQFLRKIQGQVAGIKRMLEEKRYCIDIVIQIRSAIGALHRVEGEIFRRHLNGCLTGAIKSKSETEIQNKIDEIINLLDKFR